MLFGQLLAFMTVPHAALWQVLREVGVRGTLCWAIHLSTYCTNVTVEGRVYKLGMLAGQRKDSLHFDCFTQRSILAGFGPLPREVSSQSLVLASCAGESTRLVLQCDRLSTLTRLSFCHRPLTAGVICPQGISLHTYIKPA